MRVGTLRTHVTLWRRPKTSGDSDGYEEALTPSAWWASIVPYQGQTDIRATVSQVIMRYHPQVDVDTIVRVPPAPSYADRVVADGATAYWRLNETGGATAFDRIGTAHGTISAAGVTYSVPGPLADGSTAFQFDGVAGDVDIPAGPAVAFGTGPLTIECWIKRLGLPSGAELLIDQKLDGDSRYSGVSLYFGGFGSLDFVIAPGSGDQQSSVNLPTVEVTDGQWHHLAAVVERGSVDTLRLYRDGIERAADTSAAPGWSLTGVFTTRIGTYATNTGSTFRFAGSIDEVAFYKVALTPAQVAAHYAARTIPPGRERQIHVVGVQDVENRHIELLCTCEEVWP